MKVTSVERGLDNFMIPFPSLVLKAGDHLIIRDTPDRLKEFEKILEGTLYADDAMIAPVDEEHPLKDADQQIAEVVIIEGFRLAGRTLGGIRFADRFGIITLAIHRAGMHPEKLYDEIDDNRSDKMQAGVIDAKVVAKERKKDFKINRISRFRCGTHYFTDSGIIGSKEFVAENYQRFKHLFYSKHEKKLKPKGLEGMYSLKRLSDAL